MLKLVHILMNGTWMLLNCSLYLQLVWYFILITFCWPWQAAEELGACIFVHPWDMEQGGRMSKFWLPWLVGMPSETAVAICSMLFGGVLERFPKLRVCFAHGG